MMVISLIVALAAAGLFGVWRLMLHRRHKALSAIEMPAPTVRVAPSVLVTAPPPAVAATPAPEPPNNALVHSLSPAELEALPFFLRPGHGFLLFVDCCLDRLEIDGIDVGHPHHTHAHRDVEFRGYFNVTPGSHSLTAHWQGRSSTRTIEIAPDRVYVMKMSWAQGGWVDVPPETAAAQGALTMSLLETRRLQPWPLPSLYFLNPPQPLWVNGRQLAITQFGGLIDMPPGNVHVRAGTHTACWALPPKCMQVMTFENGEPELLDPRVSAVVVSMQLRSAPRSALISHARFVAQPLDSALFVADAPPANDAIDSSEAVFSLTDLDHFDRAFDLYRLQGAGSLADYVGVLHAHYVADSVMASQVEFFEGYAERAYAHVTAAPELLKTRAGYYLRSLATDLQNTDVETLQVLGRQLQVLVSNHLQVA